MVVYSNIVLSKTLEPYYLINKSFQAQHVLISWKDGVLLIQGWILKLKKKHIRKGHQQLSPVWFFSLVSWFGYLATENRNSLSQIIIRSNRQTELQLNLASLYTRHLESLVGSIFLEDLKKVSGPKVESKRLKAALFQQPSLKWQLCYFVTQCSKLSLVFCFQSFALCLPGVCYVYTECACEDRWQRPADQTLFVPVPLGRTKVTGTWTWRLLPSGTIHE